MSRQRSAHIRRLGIVRITAVCQCGRQIEPSDFQAIGKELVLAVCSGCHRDLMEFERTWPERREESSAG